MFVDVVIYFTNYGTLAYSEYHDNWAPLILRLLNSYLLQLQSASRPSENEMATASSPTDVTPAARDQTEKDAANVSTQC